MLPTPIRIKFTKTGALQFISHLDLNRTMKTVMIRAKIPIHYSEGFNPHPKMVFALPLSIGAESVCELLDIKIDLEMTSYEIISRLNGALPPEMRVLEAYIPETKFTDIKFAEYDITADAPVDCTPLDAESVVVMKRTKTGEKECDIKPMINRYEPIPGGIRCVLSATSTDYLNPEYIASVLGLADYSIMRRRVLISDGVTEFR